MECYTKRTRSWGSGLPPVADTPEGDEPLNLAEVEGGILEDNTDRFVLKNPLHEGQQWRSTSHSLRANSESDTLKVISAGKACSVGEHTLDRKSTRLNSSHLGIS